MKNFTIFPAENQAENADFANVFANANIALNNNKLQALRIPLVFFSTSFRDTMT